MEKEIVETPTLAPAYAPYAPGVKVKKAGSMIFISGVVPNDVKGNILYKGDIRKQMKQMQDLRFSLLRNKILPFRGRAELKIYGLNIFRLQ